MLSVFKSKRGIIHTLKSLHSLGFIITLMGKLQGLLILSPSTGIEAWNNDFKHTYFVFSN